MKFPFPTDTPATLRRVGELIERGQFRPLIDRVIPLVEIQTAFEYVNSGRKIGNVVIDLHSAE